MRPRSRPRSLSQRIWYRFVQFFFRVIMVGAYNLRCEGREYIPRQGGAILLANHQSLLDPLLIGLTSDRPINALARKTLFKSQPFRLLFQSLDAIPFDRDGFGLAGLKELLKRLKRGEIALIFPEGTRSPNGKLLPIKPGFCSMARRAKVPLVPIAIAGGYESWPRQNLLPCWGVIHVHVAPAISAEEFANMDDDALVSEVENRLQSVLDMANENRRRSEAFVVGLPKEFAEGGHAVQGVVMQSTE